MSKKYLNPDRILSEGFFKKFFSAFRVTGNLQDKIKRNKDIKDSLLNLNNAQSDLEDALEKFTGKKISLNKYALKDFLF